MQANAALSGEVFLLELELCRQIKQAHLALLFRDSFVQKRQMVAEKKNRRRIIHRSIAAYQVIEKDGRHGRHILVAEAQIGVGKTGIVRLDSRDSDRICGADHVSGKDLFGERHWPWRGFNRRSEYLLLYARHIEVEQPTMLDDLACNLVLALAELGKRDLLAAPNPVNELEICRCKYAQILAVLLVNSLN